MGPAIALRLRQHLTLTPQVQQALRLLQMSALEFAQEMEQALAANPFLEENPATRADDAARDAAEQRRRGRRARRRPRPAAARRRARPGRMGRRFRRAAYAAASTCASSSMISPMGEPRPRARPHGRSTASTTTAISSSRSTSSRRWCPPSTTCVPEDFARRAAPGAEPRSGRRRRAHASRNASSLQLEALARGHAGARRARSTSCTGHLQLLGNREWARLQHAVGCDEAHAAHRARAHPHARPEAGPSLRLARGALRRARRDGEEGARALGRDHQPGVAAARAAEPRLRRGAAEPRLEPVARRASCRRRAGCCARSSSASLPSSAWPTRSWRASAASSSTAKWR